MDARAIQPPLAWMTMLALCAPLGACGKSQPPPAPVPDYIKSQQRALERAKNVSSVIDQSDQNSRQQIDDASK